MPLLFVKNLFNFSLTVAIVQAQNIKLRKCAFEVLVYCISLHSTIKLHVTTN